jgi:hypothetical protein
LKIEKPPRRERERKEYVVVVVVVDMSNPVKSEGERRNLTHDLTSFFSFFLFFWQSLNPSLPSPTDVHVPPQSLVVVM